MTDCTRCPTCGGPVDLEAKSCPYCGTRYPKPRKTAQAAVVAMTPNEAARLYIPGNFTADQQIVEYLERGMMTVNEARALYGLPPV